jgi:acetyl esterase/lipase
MLSAQAEAMKAQFMTMLSRAPGAPELQEIRAQTKMLAEVATEPAGVSYEMATAGDVPVQWVVPAQVESRTASARTVLYLHGGGYIACDAHTHARVVAHLATAVGCPAIVPEYRLAPEHPFPAAIDDCLRVYDSLLEDGVMPSTLALAGDSAGGGLALALLLRLRDQGRPQPATAVVWSPFADLKAEGSSRVELADRDPLLTAEALDFMSSSYLGTNGDVRNPLASPVYGDFTGLCPIYIQVGGDEALLSSCMRAAERAAIGAVEVRLDTFPGMFHAFQLFAGNLPEADEAIARSAAYVRDQFERAATVAVTA